ncbi:MAG: Adenylate kinase [Candidatus Magasanikbacteria bacterium GW2011_GWA2_50_22]|uniref:Adenylate kinase n=1 Tax=Candidatus Magasanikbacteria bacterium GW2011_GWA2_50_22 TaxID=1619043 RepID=A0A0G1WG97_9BACT|nr:MAG: Adenylate kinase [Candidatus Magasanikbacteria bacterium GW2011_GWA2_50_22]
MKKILIFLGPPGSGKGTQAKKIAEKYNYGHISTGDLLRALQTKKKLTTEEKIALEQMKQGQLADDEIIYSLVFKEIDRYLKNGQGVVLDGTIRKVSQAQKFQEYFTAKKMADEALAVEIALPDEESFIRLAGRRVCSRCGEIIPATAGANAFFVCPKCGGELVTRADDDRAVVEKRVREQGNVPLKPIKEFYKALGALKSVDGRQTIQKVDEDVQKILHG